ncbi:cytochrome P450 [Auricularia subglabra TFB-10046 SS5]|nr:cytochrome P450 [Auricularia subglabra TFB-10046 SS5]
MEHIRNVTASSILSFTYGIRVTEKGDRWVKMADEAIETMTAAGLPGTYLVDWIPISAVIYLGGADTTVAVITAFFLCMVLHPEKQRLAQDEIDRILGPGHLPEFSDRAALPYVEAVLLEVISMYPVLPLGLPRRVMEDDVIKGCGFRREPLCSPTSGTSILRDEVVYSRPDEFLPGRYLKDGVLDLESTVPDPRVHLFGFGRRICSGRHFADNAAWLAVATVLACFRVSPAKSRDGRDILPDGELRTGAVT